EIGEERPSHEGMSFTTCQNAGCHNFHDNGPLNEKYLDDHFGEEDFHGDGVVPLRSSLATVYSPAISLVSADHDGPADSTPEVVTQWATSRHAVAGVNCSGCHERDGAGQKVAWSDSVSLETCASCHDWQMERWGNGRHGMKYAAGLGPMTPELARLPMHADAAHRELSCNVCHDPHETDTRFAATDACLKCHNDTHSNSYVGSGHHEAWLAELAGNGVPGSGVSCATCHMPRVERPDGTVSVDHNQNHNLRPNEKMIKSVCSSCHGLQFSLNALADPAMIDACYEGSPEGHVESVDMARAWFDEKRRKRAEADARKAAAKAAREKAKAEREAKKAAEEAAKAAEEAGPPPATEEV
ncbi:MAG: cytochrome c3 family protein, partial [Planctomycetota bacterium]